jgi:autotransporter-associated beta strand protein
LRQGTLLVRHSSALGTSGSTVNIGGDSYVANGGYARLLIDAASVSVAKNLRVRSLADHNVTAVLGGNHTTGSSSFTGSVTMDLTTRLTAAGTSTVGFSGQLSGVGGLIKEGSGTVQLSTTNTFQGSTTVNAGTLQTAAASALPGGTAVTMANTAGAVLDLNGYSHQVASLGGGGGAGGNVLLGGATLTVGSGTYAGSIQEAGSLAKTGGGTFTVTGTNTYSSGTTISQGLMLVNSTGGSGTGTGSVTINGGTLGGSGLIGSASNDCDILFGASGGTLSPGTSPGRLTVYGDITLAANATFLVDLNGPSPGLSYDQLRVFDSSDLSTITLGDARLTLSLGFIPMIGTEFTIIDNLGSGGIDGIFAGHPDDSVFRVGATNYFRIDYNGGTGNDVVLEAVPEPATLSLLGLGLVGLIARRRKQQ